MPTTRTKIEQVRDLAAQVDLAGRLAMIQAIAALDLRPEEPDPDDFGRLLAEEQANWFARPATDRHRYGNDYVAVYRGKVVDHDPDQRTLYVRVRTQYGSLPILIVSAGWESAPVFTFHSTDIEP